MQPFKRTQQTLWQWHSSVRATLRCTPCRVRTPARICFLGPRCASRAQVQLMRYTDQFLLRRLPALLQVVCEHVRPLGAVNLAGYSGDEMCLGLFNVATALSFLHNKVVG